MMPKLIALARRRISAGMPSTGTPNISEAVDGVDVEAVREGALQLRDVADVGQQPQLDLAVVGADQHVARLGDEGLADLAALLGAHRDVLQVGIVGREPARWWSRPARRRCAPGRCSARPPGPGRRCRCPSAWRAGASRAAARGSAWPWAARSSSTAGVGAPGAGGGLLAAGQAHLAEQHVADLLGAAEVERPADDARAPRPPARPCAWRSRWRAGAAGPDRCGCRRSSICASTAGMRPLQRLVDGEQALARQPRRAACR